MQTGLSFSREPLPNAEIASVGCVYIACAGEGALWQPKHKNHIGLTIFFGEEHMLRLLNALLTPVFAAKNAEWSET